MKRLSIAILSFATVAGCIGPSVFDGRCIFTLNARYTVRARLVGTDGCPFSGKEIKVQLVPKNAARQVDAQVSTTDEEGQLIVGIPFGPSGHFATCVTEDEILSILREDQLAPELDQVQLAFEIDTVQHSITLNVTQELLPNFVPWDDSELDLGTLVLAGINTCTN